MKPLTSGALAALILCGCGQNPSTVTATPVVVEIASSALSTGALQWANGTYGAGCTAPSPSAPTSWSLQIGAGNLTMDHSPISVVLNNGASCVLTLTELVTSENTQTTYTANPPIGLAASYAGPASSFASGSNPIAFWGNAKIAPADFSTNFVVTIEYSDNPQLTASNVNASYTTVSASSSPTLWASPNYQLDLALTVNVDNQLVIQGSSSGTVTLDGATVTGTGYYIDMGALPVGTTNLTFAALDAGYRAAVTSTPPSPFTLALSALGLPGTLSSTTYRTIVIQRLDSASNTVSYQAFQISFTPPTQ